MGVLHQELSGGNVKRKDIKALTLRGSNPTCTERHKELLYVVTICKAHNISCQLAVDGEVQ